MKVINNESKELNLFLQFLQSNKSAKDFLEDVSSGAISSVTDKPPETRTSLPNNKIKSFNLNKNCKKDKKA